jgi:hypothetical protein
MVGVQNNVDFWTNEHLEISSLAGKQHLVLGMERTRRILFPWGLCAARYCGGI